MPAGNAGFSTRRYPYRKTSPAVGFENTAAAAPEAPLAPRTIHRLVLGLDQPPPKPMTDADIAALLRDPFAELLLKRGVFPLSLRELLQALDAVNGDPLGLPDQRSYLIADGGQIPWSPQTAAVDRFFRIALTRGRGNQVELLVSASTEIDSADNFLQLIAWDPHNEVYSYYERRSGTWVWAGNSYHALQPGTRGEGPFDSHVNGSLVMKELKIPWAHWHSQSATILASAFPPNHPLVVEPLFVNRVGAEDLQLGVVQPGIRRWTEARLKKTTAADGTISDVPYLMRQILETTTVNLVSSASTSATLTAGRPLILPLSFFINSDALLNLIGLEPDIRLIQVDGAIYQQSLVTFDFALRQGAFRQAGDTFFAFLVPEPAFEDLNVLELMLQQNIISPRFAGCLLMIDFENPIYSNPRAALMQYVPQQTRRAGGQYDLENLMVAAITAAAGPLPPNSPEQQFLRNWNLPAADWKNEFQRRIEQYFAALEQRVAAPGGFDDLVRLAESRRRQFRKQPLAEFDLTLPTTNIPANSPILRMHPDGTVGP